MMTDNRNPNPNTPKIRVIARPEGMTETEGRIYRRLGNHGRMLMKALKNGHPVLYQEMTRRETLETNLTGMETALTRRMLKVSTDLAWKYPPKSLSTMDRMRQQGAIQGMIEELMPELMEQVIHETLYPKTESE